MFIISFLVIIFILLWSFAYILENAGIFYLRLFFAKTNQFNHKKPIVAVVKQKKHFVAMVFPNFRDFCFLYASSAGRLNSFVSQISKKFVFPFRIQVSLADCAEKSKGMIKIKIVCINNRPRKVVKTNVFRNFNFPDDLLISQMIGFENAGFHNFGALGG